MPSTLADNMLRIFSLRFPIQKEMVCSYSMMDRHTLKLKCFSGEKLIFRYINDHHWSLQTEKSYKE